MTYQRYYNYIHICWYVYRDTLQYLQKILQSVYIRNGGKQVHVVNRHYYFVCIYLISYAQLVGFFFSQSKQICGIYNRHQHNKFKLNLCINIQLKEVFYTSITAYNFMQYIEILCMLELKSKIRCVSAPDSIFFY